MITNDPFPLPDHIAKIKTRDDFLAFTHDLSRDFTTHHNDWQNVTVDQFLDSLAAWTEDADFSPSVDNFWPNAALLLLAGKSYE